MKQLLPKPVISLTNKLSTNPLNQNFNIKELALYLKITLLKQRQTEHRGVKKKIKQFL